MPGCFGNYLWRPDEDLGVFDDFTRRLMNSHGCMCNWWCLVCLLHPQFFSFPVSWDVSQLTDCCFFHHRFCKHWRGQNFEDMEEGRLYSDHPPTCPVCMVLLYPAQWWYSCRSKVAEPHFACSFCSILTHFSVLVLWWSNVPWCDQGYWKAAPYSCLLFLTFTSNHRKMNSDLHRFVPNLMLPFCPKWWYYPCVHGGRGPHGQSRGPAGVWGWTLQSHHRPQDRRPGRHQDRGPSRKGAPQWAW